MNLRAFGSPEIAVSPLGWGTVKVGRNHLVKNKCADGFSLPTDKEVEDALDVLLENGVNLIDTAPAYGISEERLGKLIGSRRSKFFISTKVGEVFDGSSSHYDFSAAAIQLSVENSLRKLNTDVLDSLLLHCPRSDLPVVSDPEVMRVLIDLKSQGKVRYTGASVHTVEGGLATLENFDIVMLPFNKGFQLMRPVIEAARQKNAGVFVIKGLQQGAVGENPNDLIKFVLDEPGVSSLIFGSINIDNIKSNLQVLKAL